MSTSKRARRAADSPAPPQPYTVRVLETDTVENVTLAEGLELVASKRGEWEPSLIEQNQEPTPEADAGTTGAEG